MVPGAPHLRGVTLCGGGRLSRHLPPPERQPLPGHPSLYAGGLGLFSDTAADRELRRGRVDDYHRVGSGRLDRLLPDRLWNSGLRRRPPAKSGAVGVKHDLRRDSDFRARDGRASVYPNLVFSTPNHAYDLNIYNSASTQKTLGFMFVVAIIGVPIVPTYTVTVYYIFRGKVALTEESY